MKKGFIILSLLFAVVFTISGCDCTPSKNGLKLQGNCKENAECFLGYSEETKGSEMSETYLSAVNYEITEIDEEKMTAQMNIEVPVIADALMELVSTATESAEEKSYDDLLAEIEEKLMAEFASGKMPIESSTIEVSIEEVDGKYKIVPNDELYNLIYGSLSKAFIEALSQIGGEQ